MPQNWLTQYNGELCTWFDKLEFYFFPLYKNYTLLFALLCRPIRAKVEQKGRVIFLYWKKNKKINVKQEKVKEK